jgi:hypothetical protein
LFHHFHRSVGSLFALPPNELILTGDGNEVPQHKHFMLLMHPKLNSCSEKSSDSKPRLCVGEAICEIEIAHCSAAGGAPRLHLIEQPRFPLEWKFLIKSVDDAQSALLSLPLPPPSGDFLG